MALVRVKIGATHPGDDLQVLEAAIHRPSFVRWAAGVMGIAGTPAGSRDLPRQLVTYTDIEQSPEDNLLINPSGSGGTSVFARGDSGSPLFMQHDGWRDAFGLVVSDTNDDGFGTGAPIVVDLTGRLPGKAQSIKEFVDAAAYEYHLPNWESRHGGRKWFGERDYTGPCSPNDFDCDHWYNWHDNCPNKSNSDQLDTDDDGVGDACDNCVNAYNTEQYNCNYDIEIAQNVAEADRLGDACDPVPCPRSYLGARVKSSENCVPITGTNALDCDASYERKQVISQPIGSRSQNGALTNVNGVQTWFRFCQQDPVNLVDCNTTSNLNYDTVSFAEPPAFSAAHPWRSLSFGGTRGATRTWNYGTTNETNGWSYLSDFPYWNTNHLVLFPSGCDASCLGGTMFLHGNTAAGASSRPNATHISSATVKGWHPKEARPYCKVNIPDLNFGSKGAYSIHSSSSIYNALAAIGEVNWLALGKDELRDVDVDERPYTRVIEANQDFGLLGLGSDGRLIAAASSASTGCSSSSSEPSFADIAYNVVWASNVDPRTHLGALPESTVAVGLSEDGTYIKDVAVDYSGTLGRASEHSETAGLVGTGFLPRSVRDYAPVFSQAAGGVFVVGGIDLADGDFTGRIFFHPLGSDEWNYIDSFSPENVLAATYSFADRRLWFVNQRNQGTTPVVQVVRLDPVTGASQVVLTEQFHGAQTSFLTVDQDGSVLLFQANNNNFVPIRFSVSGSSVSIKRYAQQSGHLARIPTVDPWGLGFVLVSSSHMLTVSRAASLTQVCCNGTACGTPGTCNADALSSLF